MDSNQKLTRQLATVQTRFSPGWAQSSTHQLFLFKSPPLPPGLATLFRKTYTSCVFFKFFFFLTLAILCGQFKSPDLGRLQQLKEQPRLVLPVYMMSMFLWSPTLLFFWRPVLMTRGISAFIKTVLKPSQTLLQFPGA